MVQLKLLVVVVNLLMVEGCARHSVPCIRSDDLKLSGLLVHVCNELEPPTPCCGMDDRKFLPKSNAEAYRFLVDNQDLAERMVPELYHTTFQSYIEKAQKYFLMVRVAGLQETGKRPYADGTTTFQ